MTERRRRPPTPAEVELWRQVVADAVPVKRRRRSAPPESAPTVTAEAATAAGTGTVPPPESPLPQPPAKPRRRAPVAPTAPTAPEAQMPLRMRDVVSVDRAPGLLGAKAGLDRRTEEKVRRGRLPVDGRIDLHGMTQDRAHDALLGFVRSSHAGGRRLLLVITGKGTPGGPDRIQDGRGVLRAAVPRWLNEPAFRPLVLAVHQAQPQHGGSGALYVFLKRQR